jgi:hypothetical protein
VCCGVDVGCEALRESVQRTRSHCDDYAVKPWKVVSLKDKE